MRYKRLYVNHRQIKIVGVSTFYRHVATTSSPAAIASLTLFNAFVTPVSVLGINGELKLLQNLTKERRSTYDFNPLNASSA